MKFMNICFFLQKFYNNSAHGRGWLAFLFLKNVKLHNGNNIRDLLYTNQWIEKKNNHTINSPLLIVRKKSMWCGEWCKEMLVNANRNMVSCGTNFIHSIFSFTLYISRLQADMQRAAKNENSFYGSIEWNLKIYLM